MAFPRLQESGGCSEQDPQLTTGQQDMEGGQRRVVAVTEDILHPLACPHSTGDVCTGKCYAFAMASPLPAGPHLPRSPAGAPVSPVLLALVRVTPSPFFCFSFRVIVCVRSGFHSCKHRATSP